MSSTNGKTNGHASPAVTQAQATLEKAQRPLRELDARIANLQQQVLLTQAEAAVQTQERDKAETDLVDEIPGAEKRLQSVAIKEAETSAKLRGLNKKLTAAQAERPALDRAVQEANSALAETTAEEEYAALEEELSRARFHVAQAQESLTQKQKAMNEIADRLRVVSTRRREDSWTKQRRVAAANFVKANGPSAPGYERLRQGF